MSIINKNELIEYFQDCIYDAYEGLNVNTPESFNILRTEAILSAIDDIRTEPLLVEFNYDFDEVFNDALNSISYTGYQLYLSY